MSVINYLTELFFKFKDGSGNAIDSTVVDGKRAVDVNLHYNLTNIVTGVGVNGQLAQFTGANTVTGVTEGTAFNKDFETSVSNIKMNGAVSVGVLSTQARADHIHATDTSKADDSAVFHKATASEIYNITLKASPGLNDVLLIEDVTDFNNKKRITLGSMPGNSLDPNAIHKSTASEISAITVKTTPITADFLLIEDSADLNNKKHITIGTLPFQTPLSNPVTGTGSNGQVAQFTGSSTISGVAEKTAFNQNFETDVANIKMNGAATLGSSGNIADASHIHASDTSRAADGAVVHNTGAEVVAGVKNFSSELMLDELATPANPTSGKHKIYFKADGKAYQLNNAGTEIVLGASLLSSLTDVGIVGPTNAQILMYDSVAGKWKNNDGSNFGHALIVTELFTATAGQTIFTLANTPPGKAYLNVSIDGSVQDDATFTLVTNVVTFSEALAVGNKVRFQVIMNMGDLTVEVASNVNTDTTFFTGLLTAADTTVQKALNTLSADLTNRRYSMAMAVALGGML